MDIRTKSREFHFKLNAKLHIISFVSDHNNISQKWTDASELCESTDTHTYRIRVC